MSLIGFLTNIKEGVPPHRDFTLFRIASMDQVLRPLGAQLFVYSPRQIDTRSGEVSGFLIEDGRFVPTTAPVPEVNGSWFIGRDRSSQPTLDVLTFRAWAAETGIEVYPLHTFSSILKDKYRTFRLVRDLDPTLNPHTALYDGTRRQLSRFLRRYDVAFLKPRFGSKGDQIFSVRPVRGGFQRSYYESRKKVVEIHATLTEVLAAIDSNTGNRRFLIQQGVPIDRYEDAPFIFRVIMLDDGKQWQWVHKAVLAAPGSEIANTTQGGSNWVITDLLTKIYGADKAGELFEEIRRISFATIHHLDSLFPGKLMEVAFDFVLDTSQHVKILEINTLPGMTKPGLPPEPAFRNVFKRRASEREAFDKFVLPHGSCLARFLHTKLEERRARAARPEAPAVPAANEPRAVAATAGATVSDVRIEDPEAPLLHHVIAAQADYLVRACRPDGSFEDRDNTGSATRADPKNAPPRHAGAIYALDCYDRWHADAGVREAAQRAGQFLKTTYLAPIPGEERLLGFWTRSEFNLLGEPDQVKLGWAGLGLIALLCLERQRPGFTPIEDLRALGEFLRWGQNEDGSFRCLFVPARGGWQEDWRSIHYPGQAAFALLMLHELDPSPKWVQAAADGLGYLARARANAAEIPADHWALLATARLLPVGQEGELGASRAAVVRHAEQVCKSILCEQIWNPAHPVVDGGFVADGRTEPTSVRLEGLLAAQTFVDEGDPELGERIRVATQDAIEFLLRASVADGGHPGPIPRAIRPLPDDGTRAVERFNRRAAEVRLDYVQHALCAMLGYAQLYQPVLESGGLVTRRATPQDDGAPARTGASLLADARVVDKLLFTPGPLTTSRRVKEAMLRDLGSRDAQFIATVQRIRDRLLGLAGVSRETGFEAVPIQGSGTFAIEAVVSSVVPRDGRLLVVSNGAYAERIAAIARCHGIDTDVLRFAEDAPPDLAAVDRALGSQPRFTHVAAVHCETSTGMLNPVAGIGSLARQYDCSYLIDSMSAFGAVPVDLEDWGVDFLVSSANKCIEGVPGFAFVLCRRAALESSQGRARSVSLDLFAQWAGLQANGQFRFTPPTHALLAFEMALQELEDEGGVAGRGARYRANQECLVQGMRRLGFGEYLAPELQGPIITSFRCPDVEGFDFDRFYQLLNAKGFVIYPGKVTAAECFRIGSIGHVFEQDVRNLLAAIEVALDEMGVDLEA